MPMIRGCCYSADEHFWIYKLICFPCAGFEVDALLYPTWRMVAFKIFQNRVQVIGNTILITSSSDELTCDHTLTLYNFYISNYETVYSAQTAFVQLQKLKRYCEWTLKHSCTGTSERDTHRRSIPPSGGIQRIYKCSFCGRTNWTPD